jgi:hypothetical protein
MYIAAATEFGNAAAAAIPVPPSFEEFINQIDSKEPSLRRTVDVCYMTIQARIEIRTVSLESVGTGCETVFVVHDVTMCAQKISLHILPGAATCIIGGFDFT